MAMLSTNVDGFTDTHVDFMIKQGMFQKEQKESLKKEIQDGAQKLIKWKYELLFDEADEDTKETLELGETAFDMMFSENNKIDTYFLALMATEGKYKIKNNKKKEG